jgi:hypothetical protein
MNPCFLGMLLVLAACLSSCSKRLSYRSFTGETQKYYETFSEACEQLRTNTPHEWTDGRKISPENLTLPPVIKALHPIRLNFGTNVVFVVVGTGQDAYGIAWQYATDPVTQLLPNGHSWELRAYCVGADKLLYTRTKY